MNTTTQPAAYSPTMIMEISVRLVSQYGNERIQPACEKAELFCRIAGCKTLTQNMVRDIKALGYRVNVLPNVAEL